MTQPFQQISFSVPEVQYRALARRAAHLNLRPAQYAQRLFDAAYLARIAAEKGTESGDRALDRMVQKTFLLADCEPEFIAHAIGAPAAWVTKILEGWRRAARRPIEGGEPRAETPADAAPAAATPACPGPPGHGKPFTADEVAMIGRRWAEGATVKEIAAELGRTAGALSMWTSKNRHVCPKRLKDKAPKDSTL